MTERSFTIETLPPRIPASVVCTLAGYSKSTLGKRIKAGKMPPPVDRGQENLFDKEQVCKALKIGVNAAPPAADPWEAALNK